MTPKASTEVLRALSGWEIPSHISLPSPLPLFHRLQSFPNFYFPSLHITNPLAIDPLAGSGGPFPLLYYIFSSKTYGSNSIKQHSETVMV